MITYILTAILVTLITYLCIKTYKTFNYFKNRGIKTAPRCYPILGHVIDIMLTPKRWEVNDKLYKIYKSDGMYGMFELFGKPNLQILDTDLMRDILVKEADNFIDRRKFDMNDPYFNDFLTMLEGERWKAVRSIISPTFSSGKIKGMYSLINDKAKDLVTRSARDMEETGFIDAKRISSLFTLDVISTCAFGLDAKCLLDKNSEDSIFVKSANDVMAVHIGLVFKFLFMSISQTLNKILGLKFSGASQDYLISVLNGAFEERVNSGFRRGDYLDLLIEAKEENDKKGKENKCDFNMITTISQAYLFLLAGFDTTSTAISFVIYCLAKNLPQQDNLRQHLAKILESDGEFNYQNIMECHYLDAVINETLRLLPVAFMLERRCVQDFKVKGKNVTIEEGTMITIPAYSIHHDPQYWDDPEDFKPERFLPENKEKIQPFTYMPFGLGPRNCIAMRFALLEVKICIATMCSSFEMKLAPNSKDLAFEHSGGGVMKPKIGSINIHLNKLDASD